MNLPLLCLIALAIPGLYLSSSNICYSSFLSLFSLNKFINFIFLSLFFSPSARLFKEKKHVYTVTDKG